MALGRSAGLEAREGCPPPPLPDGVDDGPAGPRARADADGTSLQWGRTAKRVFRGAGSGTDERAGERASRGGGEGWDAGTGGGRGMK